MTKCYHVTGHHYIIYGEYYMHVYSVTYGSHPYSVALHDDFGIDI